MLANTVVALLVLVLQQAASLPACPPSRPEDIVACIEAAHRAGDIHAVGALLSDDYVMVDQNGQMTRKEDLRATEKMFADYAVELTFDPDFTVEDGERPSTWALEGLRATMTVSPRRDGLPGPFTMTDLPFVWFVRRRGENGPIEIYRWERLPNE